MRIRLRHLWEVLTSGYWFVPTVMTAVAVAMAFALLYVDRVILGAQPELRWIYSGSAEGARTLLSTVAGSIVTVAGVVFSITIAALSQASSQFGPRLLRNFMRDTGNQVVLGTFLATFLYCLLVLRTVHGESERRPPFVPNLSVSVAVLLAMASIAVLIYFIHHVSMSLQAPAVVAAVSADLDRVIAQLSDSQKGASVETQESEPVLPGDFEAAAGRVINTHEGYVQAVDYDTLIDMATEGDLLMRLEYRPGDYMIRGDTLARVWPADRYTPELSRRVNDVFICGHEATPEQDVEYAIRQMVEVAVRALSPGVNDPFTAINCLDTLGSALCRISQRGLPGPLRYDREGRLRLVTPVTTFTGAVDMAFNQIRQYARESVAVMARMLETITAIAGQVCTDAQREVLLKHAEMVHRQAETSTAEPRDREDLRRRWDAARQALGNGQPVDTQPSRQLRVGQL